MDHTGRQGVNLHQAHTVWGSGTDPGQNGLLWRLGFRRRRRCCRSLRLLPLADCNGHRIQGSLKADDYARRAGCVHLLLDPLS